MEEEENEEENEEEEGEHELRYCRICEEDTVQAQHYKFKDQWICGHATSVGTIGDMII